MSASKRAVVGVLMPKSSTGKPEKPPRIRRDLAYSAEAWLAEISKLYREVRQGKLTPDVAAKLTYVARSASSLALELAEARRLASIDETLSDISRKKAAQLAQAPAGEPPRVLEQPEPAPESRRLPDDGRGRDDVKPLENGCEAVSGSSAVVTSVDTQSGDSDARPTPEGAP